MANFGGIHTGKKNWPCLIANISWIVARLYRQNRFEQSSLFAVALSHPCVTQCDNTSNHDDMSLSLNEATLIVINNKSNYFLIFLL
jgi:hypothetical protein